MLEELVAKKEIVEVTGDLRIARVNVLLFGVNHLQVPQGTVSKDCNFISESVMSKMSENIATTLLTCITRQ